MKLDLVFWGSDGANDEAAIRRQVDEWATAEPNVIECRVERIHQPMSDRHFWWQVDVVLTFRDELTQGTLWAA